MKKQVKNKVLVFGHGQMAGFIPGYFSNVTISYADITKPAEIERDIKKFKPTVVINTAAKTSIDWCELNKLEAFNINVLGAMYVWEACKKHDIYLVHFSSGCIFSSPTPDLIYTEEDRPNPQCYYSWTKVWAENMLGESSKLLILRPRVVISALADKRNSLSKWMVYSHFISDLNTVTVIEDMFPVVKKMVEKRLHGVYNIANIGLISPLEIACVLRRKVNPDMKIAMTTLEEVNRNLVAKRVTTVLSMDKLKKAGFKLPSVDQSIPRIIDMFKKNLDKAGGLKALDMVRSDTKAKYSILKGKPSTYQDEN